MLIQLREPVNAWSHFVGFLCSCLGLVALLGKSLSLGTIFVVAATVYGLSLMLLYAASAIYHGVKANPGMIKILRRVDHCMIYVLIAGTYTPICLLALKGLLGRGLLIGVWSLALAGMVFKLIWFHAPRWLSTGCYLLLGWLAIFFILPIARVLPPAGLALLLGGGLLYSAGALFYALKPVRLRFFHLGFHEIFHLFILAGSVAHFLLIYIYIL